MRYHEESATRSLCLDAKQSIDIFTQKFLKNGDACETKHQKQLDVTPRQQTIFSTYHAVTQQFQKVRFSADKTIPVVLRPVYSPDLSLRDFVFSSWNWKITLREVILGHSKNGCNRPGYFSVRVPAIDSISSSTCYEARKNRFPHWVISQGAYFQVDNIES